MYSLEVLQAMNAEGSTARPAVKEFRANPKAIRVLKAKLEDARNELADLQAEEIESGYEFDYTMDRKYFEGVVSGLEIAIDYLENKED